MDRFLAIDEEGYFLLPEGIRLSDQQVGYNLFENLSITPEDFHCLKSTFGGTEVFIEAFDKPLVAQQIFKDEQKWSLLFPYNWRESFQINSLCLDSWDRFHGLTDRGIPFVLSRKAQAEFFNLLESFTDETITSEGQIFDVYNYYIEDKTKGTPEFWQKNYEDANTPWDLDEPHPSLSEVLPQLKILKSRVINFGCGRGHDAAYLAKQGHLVTAIDISETAIETATNLYGNTKNLHFNKGDVFKTSENKFDLCLEHTTFCAVPPSKRKELIQRWSQSLEDEGFLLGIFFVMPKRSGPPYGCSEWELRALLEKKFRLLYWKRWQHSPGNRQGSELIVYAQKR